MWNKLRKVSNPFQDMTRKERKAEIRRTLKRIKASYKESGRHSYGLTKPTLRTAKRIFEDSCDDVWYANNLYQVNVNYEHWDEDNKDGLIHLSIKNHERTTYIPWQDKQWIKNDICGDEMEAVEIFPAESRMVNTANQYHLWVMNKVPFGFPAGLRLGSEDQPGGEGSRGKQTLATREGR